MAPRTRSASKPRNDKPETSWKLRKRQRVADVETPFLRLKLGPTTRSAGAERRETKKRGKATNKRVKNQGKLAAFMGLPLDILSEVTSFLLPIDVLQLSRVSTYFRELFYPDTARHFWVNARRNVPELPECPPDLNEAQFASLLFENRCQACGTPTDIISDFVLRHRTCRPCYKELTSKGNLIVSSFRRKEPESVVLRLVPPCFGSVQDLGVTTAGYFEYRTFNIRELTSAIEQYKHLNRNKEKQKQFVEKCEKLSKIETGWAMRRWLNNQKTQKEKEERVKSELRLQEAKNRLLELGWTQKDLDDARVMITKLMYLPRELTPYIWKQFLPTLEDAMMKCRRAWRRRELHMLWRPILQKVVPTSEWIFVPDNREITNIACIRALLDRDEGNVELTRQALEDIFPTVLQETQAHQEAVRRIFLRAILESEEYLLPLLNGRKTRTRLLDKQISPDDPRLFYARHLFCCGAGGCNERAVMSLARFYDHMWSTHNRLDPKWLLVGFAESDTIQEVMKEILKVMGLREDVKGEDVEEFEGKLQCGCTEHARFGFVSLAQHFYDREGCERHLPSKVSQLVSVR